jgi:hypothetical protein
MRSWSAAHHPEVDPCRSPSDGERAQISSQRRPTGKETPIMQARRLTQFLTAALAATAAAPATCVAGAPPILKVTGHVLRWSPSGSSNRYEVLELSPSARRTVTVRIVRLYRPPTPQGPSVTYSVRAANGESTWSNSVSIANKPEPPPPPPPEEEAPHEGLAWMGDPARPILEDWANVAAEPGRVTIAPNLAMPGGMAYSVELRDGDNPGGYGERAEIAQGNPTRAGFENRLFRPNQDLWIAVPIIFGSDWPVATNSWNVFMQVKQLGGMGTPILSMGSDEAGRIALFSSASIHESSETIARWRGPVLREQLCKFVLHVKFSPDPAIGFVELVGDPDGLGMRQLMALTHMSTMKVTSGGEPITDQARIGQYRDAAAKMGTSHVYYGRYVVASSRATAEALAFS